MASNTSPLTTTIQRVITLSRKASNVIRIDCWGASILLVLLVVAGDVYAEPIHVIAKGASKTNANIRFGHALAIAHVSGNDDSVGRLVRPAVVITASIEIKREGRHFCGALLREKAIHMSTAFSMLSDCRLSNPMIV
ncbi:hypothetical protein BV22DRAFT_1135615 [Leucogyrophana mollusca]|uniref:Uncharacterized protein n=1 Tax=Leucogyrophana mollusca TaxID=85980 RepID=A0ACB8AUU0_9AGAM|nr:hypothetical protein BV22DRAFT_1135615 [Leucogyrophana mollusca]